MLRAGLIGCGWIATAHKKAYRRLAAESRQVEIQASVDIRPEQLQDLGDIRTYTDIDEMLSAEQGKLDYVDICLPTYLHAETAVKAMKAGYNVLCEKPMARTYEQALWMCRTAEETGKTLMVGHCNRFMSVIRAMREICLSGELGRMRSADFFREGGNTEPLGYKNWFRNGNLSGGAILDLHIHDVDIICWLFGPPRSVSAAAAVVIPGSGYDAMSVNYHFGNGVFVHAGCDWTISHDKYNTRATRINFEKGYVFCDRTPGREVFVKVTQDGFVTDLSELLKNDFFHEEILYYTDCLKDGRSVDICPPDQSALAVRVVMAEIASADNGGMLINLGEVKE